MRKILISFIFATAMLASCNKGDGGSGGAKAPLTTQEDSLAYIVGLNIANNLMQMDSMINADVVCRAISDRFKSSQIISDRQARDYYLRYLTYVEPERRRSYEERYLSDLASSSRTYTRTNSGLTYTIDVIGDEKLTPRNNNDLLSIRYTISRVDGSEVYSSYERKDTTHVALKDLNLGVKEAVKMIGSGGKFRAWLPSSLAFGDQGDEELEIEPFETLLYKVEVLDVERNGARKENRTEW